jgi:hypothetical protein
MQGVCGRSESSRRPSSEGITQRVCRRQTYSKSEISEEIMLQEKSETQESSSQERVQRPKPLNVDKIFQVERRWKLRRRKVKGKVCENLRNVNSRHQI